MLGVFFWDITQFNITGFAAFFILYIILIISTSIYLVSLPYENKKSFNKYIAYLLFAFIFMIICGQFLTYINKNTDDITYTFNMDEQLIGDWGLVDYVENQEDFQVDKQNYDISKLKLDNNTIRNGKSYKAILIMFIKNEESKNIVRGLSGYRNNVYWTKGYFINESLKTMSSYVIKEIDNQKYLFVENKDADYVYLHRKPMYYVFVKFG